MPPPHPETEAIVQAIIDEVPLKVIAGRFNTALTTVQQIKVRHTLVVRVRRPRPLKAPHRHQVQLELPLGDPNA